MHSDLAAGLAGELVSAGFTADPDQKKRVNARAFWRGAELFEDLREKLGQELIPFRARLILSLGVGAVMT